MQALQGTDVRKLAFGGGHVVATTGGHETIRGACMVDTKPSEGGMHDGHETIRRGSCRGDHGAHCHVWV